MSGLWASRISYDGNDRIQYIGKAVAGSGDNDPVWSIKRLTYDGTSHRILTEAWPGGDSSYKWRWSARGGYTYS